MRERGSANGELVIILQWSKIVLVLRNNFTREATAFSENTSVGPDDQNTRSFSPKI